MAPFLRKIAILCIGLLFPIGLPCPQASAEPLSAAVKSAVLMDVATGRILYTQNPDLPIPPASITKIMTLFLAYEAVDEGRAHWADKVRISKRAGKTGGSRMLSLHFHDADAGRSGHRHFRRFRQRWRCGHRGTPWENGRVFCKNDELKGPRTGHEPVRSSKIPTACPPKARSRQHATS